MALIAVPAAPGDAGGGAVLCGVAVHSNGDRGSWAAEYINVFIRAVPIEALVTMSHVTDIEEFTDMSSMPAPAAGRERRR